jgi:hypothetical protein
MISVRTICCLWERKSTYVLAAVHVLHVIQLGAEANRCIRSFEAGEVAFKRYETLVGKDTLPFVRAAESDRVIESAMNWMVGECFSLCSYPL